MRRLIASLLNHYKQRRTFTKEQAAQIELVLTNNIEVYFE